MKWTDFTLYSIIYLSTIKIERLFIIIGIIFLIYAIPFIIGAIAMMIYSSLNDSDDEFYALIRPCDGLEYWIRGLGILIIALPLIVIFYSYVIKYLRG